MGRRGREPDRKPRTEPLNAPFAELGKRVRVRPTPTTPVRRTDSASVDPDPFLAAMAGVVPLARDADRRIERPAPAGAGRRPRSEDVEALATLSDLIDGAARFDLADTREYVEGAIIGLDPRVLRRLRRGDYAWQAYIDLHGMTAETARIAVDRFLADAVAAGHRCVLIVHGRGRNSKDQTPVLKERMKVWLARGRAAHVVLAFTTARAYDGGAGALYVLLRRDRMRRPIRVIEGAKS
jgi:DNA-nicking Smr family endonuclease